MNPQRVAAQRLPLLPARVSKDTPGAVVNTAASQAGDLFWKCAVECFKPVYTRIDARYGGVNKDKHEALLYEAKKILQEHRNLIVQAVVPMFAVRLRRPDDGLSEADTHAEDYFCRNVFPVMIDTLVASLDLFVLPDDVSTVESAVRKIADVQRGRLSAQLQNFKFEFRPVRTHQEIRKGK